MSLICDDDFLVCDYPTCDGIISILEHRETINEWQSMYIGENNFHFCSHKCTNDFLRDIGRSQWFK